MILQALNRYYDILTADLQSGVSPRGYSIADVSFALNLSTQGTLLDIFPLFDSIQRGKRSIEVPCRLIVPEQKKRSGRTPPPNFLWDNCTYVLGISKNENPQYAAQRYKMFREWNKELLAKTQSIAAQAVISFLDTYDPQKCKENPVIANHYETLMERGGNLVFKLEGCSGYVHEDSEIREMWKAYKESTANNYVSQCLVTGRVAPIARLHPSLKGIKDTNPSGGTLVGFNAPAFESYNKTGENGQGLNAPVSEEAAFAYTSALNYLLSRESRNSKFTIGDTTVVYWAESESREYIDIFAGLLGITREEVEEESSSIPNEDSTVSDNPAEQRMREIAQKVKRGEALDHTKLLEGLNIDKDTRFYVLGLSPNVARVSVRFFHMDPFVKIVQKIMLHYQDLQIIREFDNEPSMIPIWRIPRETVSKKSTDKKASPLMAGAVFRSILNNTPYPAALYYAIINRIRADMDDPSKGVEKINYIRASIIKAYLTRKYRNKAQAQIKEVLCMSLNKNATHQAYLLGRLFAVLEKAQKDAAAPVKLNATIKDRYFTSACAAPGTVFPVLLRLSQHHISKAEYGYKSDERIEEIMGLLDVNNQPFPVHLSLDEQGIFVLGYYHQRAAFYVPINNTQGVEV